ncbi:hypothetical protein FQN57_004867 [Myotisia sp. PD_48]|nr:hypothetical protein FQN57_004867 [Myotisia sp. PD_48]
MATSISTQDASLHSKKRKREEDVEVARDQKQPALSKTEKRKRARAAKAAKLGGREHGKMVSEDGGIDEAIGNMDGQLLADFFVQKAKRHNKELSAVELNDLYIPVHAFRDTSSWKSKRKLENMPDFLKTFSSDHGASLSQASEINGDPHTLVITLAGLRAAEITRALRQFQNQECAVAKLFAKHIKLKEAQESVEKTRIGIGIGTPVRLNDLVKSKALKLDSLKRIVIDGSFIDQKKRGIFDMKDLHFPLLEFLNLPELCERYTSEEQQVQLLVF